VGWACRTIGGGKEEEEKKMKNAYKLLVRKPEGRRPVGIIIRRWVDKVKIEIREMRWGIVDWIALAQDKDKLRALANAVTNLRVPQIAGKF
jgi:hypothetical protein